MTDDKTGGPAFARSSGFSSNGQQGMTLRDYFAAKAIPVVNENFSPRADENSADWAAFVANTAYAVADAMLEARK